MVNYPVHRYTFSILMWLDHIWGLCQLYGHLCSKKTSLTLRMSKGGPLNKLVTNSIHLDYEQRVLHIGLPTLVRRNCPYMIQLYMIMNEFDVVNFDNIQISTSANMGHKDKLKLFQCCKLLE
ncbi:hypothetical protein ACF0H5_003245 [Mactra antiquata]